jgi:hypothetical protein
MMPQNVAVVTGEVTKGTEPQKAPAPVEAKADSKKLEAAEKLELEKHETLIGNGNRAFFEVGDALNVINKSKLYRESYQTFDDYVEKRWLMSKPAAYRYMFAGDVMAVLAPEGGVLPRNESQLRPFAVLKVERDEWKDTWNYIVKKAKSKPLSAVLITTLIFEKRGQLPPKPKKGAKKVAGTQRFKDKLKPVLKLVAAARKKLNTGESTGMKSLLRKIETQLKKLKLA